LIRDDGSHKSNTRNQPPQKSEAELDQEVFDSRMRQWFADLDPDTHKKLSRYFSELVRFNKAINLVSPNTLKTAASVHFADSLLAGRIVLKSLHPNHPLYDIGSGNGFPGLVLAIVKPDLKIILVERDSRKAEFLKAVGSNLKLQNLEVKNSDVEDLEHGSLVNVVSRGFAPMHKALLMTRKQVAKGGRYFHMKSDGWATETAAVPSQLFSYWSPSLLGQYRLPETSNDMAVVLTEKIAD
jgi:16S rRNA (guanine527-N7)-methyltransferase